MLLICFSTACHVLMQTNSNESYSEMSGITWSVINITQEYSMSEKVEHKPVQFLMNKKNSYCVFISQAGLLILTVSYRDAKLVWLFQ